MVHLMVDGKLATVAEGATILDAAKAVKIEIPTLCYLKGLTPEASCRMCMVEVKGMPKLVTACSFPVSEGMYVETESPRVIEARRGVLELLMSKHDTQCFECQQDGNCKLQDYCFKYGVKNNPVGREKLEEPIDSSSKFFTYNPNLCILCHRCVNTCQKLVGVGAIDTTRRGYKSKVSPPFGIPWNESVCESCGNCVSNCPTGALQSKVKNPYRFLETEKVRTTCTYCGVGCQLDLLVKNDKVVDVLPADGPVNEGLLCVKGRFAYDFINSKDRLTKPMIRKDGVLVESTWEEAMSLVASKIQEAKDNYGPDSVAGFSSARTINEDNYLFQKMLRAAVGTNNVDHCARL